MTNTTEDQTLEMKSCPFCAEPILAAAVKCKHCKSDLSGKASHSQGQVITIVERAPKKSLAMAIVLAVFFGGIGLHKFYIGRLGEGMIYLLFCWTGIPFIFGWIEAFQYLLCGNDEKFTRVHCR
jgi:TM2 domain-containing membrane protein YozV